MRLLTTTAILASLLLIARCPTARADGGSVRLVERHAEIQISVFTSPNPLRAGPVDISVLVQDAASGQPIADARVQVNLIQRDGKFEPIHAIATSAAATNKLLLAAQVDLPEPGSWDVEVVCESDRDAAKVHFAMEAGERLPSWLTLWPWFSWPIGAVLLFGVHRLLVCRKQTASANLGK
jgi:hypothetical protein